MYKIVIFIYLAGWSFYILNPAISNYIDLAQVAWRHFTGCVTYLP